MKLKKKIFSIVLATVAMAGIATQGMLAASAGTYNDRQYKDDFSNQYKTSYEYGRCTPYKYLKKNAVVTDTYYGPGVDTVKGKNFQDPFHELYMEVNENGAYGKVYLNRMARNGGTYGTQKYDKVTLFVNALYKSKGYCRTETNQYYYWGSLCNGDKVEVSVPTPGHPERVIFRMTNNTINYVAQATYYFNK